MGRGRAARAVLPRDAAETHEVVELDSEPVGCLCSSSTPDAVKLHRVFLLPKAQGRGLGTRLVREIVAAARASGRPVRLRCFA